ncbi:MULTISPECIES: hypothetical protein [unclassified Anabaena]|uniref:hypothetical protein n=1 Tax=unclassified Anabaena TaxID=2619674 RepID=UPI000ACCF3A6|nr:MULTISPECIES: hypothetical protein [unclassified Anabaena]
MATPRFAIRQIKITKSPPNNHPITSCKSSNPENPDMATPRFAIRQIKITNSPPKIIQSHPVNPQILKILIWLRHASLSDK